MPRRESGVVAMQHDHGARDPRDPRDPRAQLVIVYRIGVELCAAQATVQLAQLDRIGGLGTRRHVSDLAGGSGAAYRDAVTTVGNRVGAKGYRIARCCLCDGACRGCIVAAGFGFRHVCTVIGPEHAVRTRLQVADVAADLVTRASTASTLISTWATAATEPMTASLS